MSSSSLAGKEYTCKTGDPSSIPGSGESPEERIGYQLQYSWASLVPQLVRKSACNVGNLGSIPGLRRDRLPTPVFWPEEVHGVPKSQTGLRNFHSP